MADNNKLLHEEESCKTNKVHLYTMSTILHIQILLHAVQPLQAETFLATFLEPCHTTRTFPHHATRTFPYRATRSSRNFPHCVVQNLKPKTSSCYSIKPKTPKPTPYAIQSRTRNLPSAVPSKTFETLVIWDWWCRRCGITISPL